MSETSSGRGKLKGIIWALILLGLGIAMVCNPGLMEGAEANGRRSGLKALLIMIWGLPVGILCILGGLGIGAFTVKR